MSISLVHLSSKALTEWITRAFKSVGLQQADAICCAQMLVQTSLWGIDSHGVARVPHYLNRLGQGSISPNPKLVFTRTAAGTGQVDGGHGLGFVVCEFAMRHAIELACDAGVGVVGVANSSHCGAIGLYTRQATRAGKIGIAFTHSDSFVVPYGGSKAFFGTNPISIAIPGTNPERPFCVDMATSIVPWNYIMNARRENREVSLGLGVDIDGEDTTDPQRIMAVKPMASYKGYALAFAIDMLCGPLNAMAYGPQIAPMYAKLDEHRRLGSLMMALDPERFAGGATIASVLISVAAALKQQDSAILVPGDPEYHTAESRTRDGIPIEPGLLDELLSWSVELGIAPPEGLK
jgi:ureidoglycolate dehydrogenase (NAD+)